MILHCVFCALKASATQQEIDDVMAALSDLKQQIPGFTHFSHGPNIDLEGKSPGYSYGFVMTFADQAALKAYHQSPAHQAAGQRLVALCENGAEGIMVFDLAT